MYLIKMVSFDSLENQINKAICVDNVGIINGDEQDAQKWIDDHKPTTTYIGWDGHRYPYYEKEFIGELHQPNHSTTNAKRLVINTVDATQKILDFISSDELDKQFKCTTFSDDVRYKNAMIHGLCLAGMVISTCARTLTVVSDQNHDVKQEK